MSRVALILAALAVAQEPAPSYSELSWEGRASTEVKHAAMHGDKHAQFELGRRYETGDRIGADTAQARKWYRRAAHSSVSRRFYYSGPVGSERRGTVVEVGQPEVEVGIPEAETRLRAMGGQK